MIVSCIYHVVVGIYDRFSHLQSKRVMKELFPLLGAGTHEHSLHDGAYNAYSSCFAGKLLDCNVDRRRCRHRRRSFSLDDNL